MELYDAIFVRKSVRKYDPAGLPPETIEEIRHLVAKTDRMDKAVDLRLHLAEDGRRVAGAMGGIIGNLIKVVAPHYLVIASEASDHYLENAGYAVEQVVLAMTAMGLATCWLGGQVQSRKALGRVTDIPDAHRLIGLVAFGRPADPGRALRKSPDEARRREIKDLVISGDINEEWVPILEAARLAPSAVNTQPWRFALEPRTMHLYTAPGSGLAGRFLEKTNALDAGIALSHVRIAAAHSNRNVHIDHKPVERRGYRYITDVTLD